MVDEDKRVYQALAVPNEALANGGVEILRAGLIDDELYVSARRAFKDPSTWGEILADIARQIALYYSAEDTDLTEKEVLAEIEEAFAADLGATVVEEQPARRAKAKKAAPPAKRKAAKPPAKKPARASSKRKKR
jgi:hypothetical protein